MPSISTDTRVILWVAAAIAGALFAVIGNELAKNFVYFFSRRGRPPAKRPILVWVIFFLSLAISVISGAFAAFAPDLPDTAENPPVAIATRILPTSTTAPTATSLPALFPRPSITQVIEGFGLAGYGKRSALVRDSQGKLTLFLRDPNGDLAFVQSSDVGTMWSEPDYFYQLPSLHNPGLSAAIDSADQIHVVWGHEPEASDAHYGLLIDQEWAVPDQIVGTGSFARDIAVDSANHPHLAWSGIGIFHITYDGTKWIEPPEQILTAGWHPDIQIDANDKVLVFLNDAQFYAIPGVSVYEVDNIGGHWNEPVKLSTSPFWSGAAAAALDSQGDIYVAWIGSTTESGGKDQVFFSRFIGGVWQSPFPVGEVNTSAGSTGQESPAVAFDSNDVFYVFWRGLNSDNHPVIFARALATENSQISNVTQGWSPQIELSTLSASNTGWPSVADVWREYREVGVDIVWSAAVGRDQVIEYAHVSYP